MSKLVSPDAYERQLIDRHPRLAAYLDMMITIRPMWGGGWDVSGETFASESDANEAKRAQIMQKLIEANLVKP